MKWIGTYKLWLISLLFSSLTIVYTYGQSAKEHFDQGVANYEAGELEKAIRDFTHAIELDANYAEAYINRGLAYYGLGKFQQAIADYNKAIELDPSKLYAYYNRGLAYHSSGDLEQAIEDFELYLELAPLATNREIVINKIAELKLKLKKE